MSIIDLLHNFHLECGARLHKLRVYETLTDPTGREVCGYLLVRGGVHAHAYALAIKKITGVEIEKMLPTPNINLDRDSRMPEVSRRGLASPPLYLQPEGLCGDGRHLGQRRDGACPAIRPASWRSSTECPRAARSMSLKASPSAFTPDYAPEEMFEIASQALQEVALIAAEPHSCGSVHSRTHRSWA